VIWLPILSKVLPVILGILLATVTMVSQLTIPLILIIIGCQLNFRMHKLRLPELFSAGLFTMFVLPPPFVIPLFMEGQAADHQDYVSNTLSLGTFLTLAAFIVVVAVFR